MSVGERDAFLRASCANDNNYCRLTSEDLRMINKVHQRPQFSISSPDRKRGLTSIIETLKTQRHIWNKDTSLPKGGGEYASYGDTNSTEASETGSTTVSLAKPRRRRLDRSSFNNNGPSIVPSMSADYALHNNNNNISNNNNNVKNERLSPGTPDTSSRSRSVTPSSETPSNENPLLPLTGRNYSDIMRSLAAKYNNTNPNDYFGAARNGFAPPLDPRFKPSFPSLLPALPTPSKEEVGKKTDFTSIINQFTSTSMFPPLIDMSSTQTLLAMVRTAKEAELQGLLKSAKRQESASPLDLSAGAPPTKKVRTKTSSVGSNSSICAAKRDQSESPRLHEDVSSWSVDDVCNFVSNIDICAEYVQNFRDQRIDGSGLPLLTEEHLTSTMNMKLGPALKLKSILAKKLGSCSVCLHCTHCHNNATSSPEPSTNNNGGNTSDSGGTS